MLHLHAPSLSQNTLAGLSIAAMIHEARGPLHSGVQKQSAGVDVTLS